MNSHSFLSGAIAGITALSAVAVASPASAYTLVSSYEATEATRYNFAAVINGLHDFDNADGALTRHDQSSFGITVLALSTFTKITTATSRLI
ncbi:MAG: hypothetical protein AAF685_02140 [Cyanobacteria bacterium P01_C01_bin.89]